MTDCFFVAAGNEKLPDALFNLQHTIVANIATYKDNLHAKDKGHRDAYDVLVKFEIQSYTIMPEMVPVQSGLLAAGTQPQFMTVYTVVALIVVTDTRAK
jgi:hypothetical protein